MSDPKDPNLENGARRLDAVFLQWKGTTACLDLHCPECGHHSHWDQDFMYAAKCPKCGRVWVLQSMLAVVDADEIGYRGVVQESTEWIMPDE